MSKFAEYNTQKKEVFLQKERTTGLEKEQNIASDYDYTSEELKEHYAQRQSEGDIKARTKYYFEDEAVMSAKATRYRTLADHGDALNQYSRKYTNHSANKRKKSARKAAGAFDKAKDLENQYKNEKTDSVTKLKHKEKIIRARLEGMKLAAEVKSRSKANEAYRKLKAKISCLTILKEQADELWENEKKEDIKQKLSGEILRIDKELQKAQNEMTKMAPPVVTKWEKDMGIPDKLSSITKTYKARNKDIDSEGAEVVKKMKTLSLEIMRPECEQALKDLEKNKMYEGYKYSDGDLSRLLQFPMRAVLRDAKGMPINAEEQKKADHNKKWLHSLSTGNVQEKNEVLLESFKHYESLHVPSPREFRERGPLYYLRKCPAEFYELQRMSLTYSNLMKYDPFVKEYVEAHPEFMVKVDAAMSYNKVMNAVMKSKCFLEQNNSDHFANDNSSYGITDLGKDERASYDKEFFDELYKVYEESYKLAYSNGPVNGDVLEKISATQKDSITTFLSKNEDTYDKDMRAKLDAPASSELGKDLFFNNTPKDLVPLASQAYEKVIGKENLSLSGKQQRAEAAAEKKKLQVDLREKLGDFLVERQINMSKSLERDYYTKIFKTGKMERKDDKKVEGGGMDQRFLKFVFDWTSYSPKSEDTVTSMADKYKTNSSIPDMIMKRGELILSLDLSMFEYNSDEEFVSKLKDNYMWLNRAQSMDEAFEISKADNHLRNDKNHSISVLKGRLLALREIKKDYDARIAMMNSNYYALLSSGDLNGLSDEELLEKQNASAENDKELSEFIMNYRYLKQEKEGFKKGAKAADREAHLAEQPKQQEADRMDDLLSKVKHYGLEKHEDEEEKDYEKRIIETLSDDLENRIPKIDDDFVKNNAPNMTNTVGSLLYDDINRFEGWISDTLANEKLLLDKGFKQGEIEKLKAMREESFAARKSVEIQAYVNNVMGFEWDPNTLEKPENNEKVSKESYDKLKAVFTVFQKVSSKIGVPKDHLKNGGAEHWYVDLLQHMSNMFTNHGIYFNKEFDSKVQKSVENEKKRIEKEIESGDKVTVNIAGKEYNLPKKMDVIKEFDGKTVSEGKREIFEQKMDKLLELCYYSEGLAHLSAYAPKGDCSYEYAQTNYNTHKLMDKMVDEIRGLFK